MISFHKILRALGKMLDAPQRLQTETPVNRNTGQAAAEQKLKSRKVKR